MYKEEYRGYDKQEKCWVYGHHRPNVIFTDEWCDGVQVEMESLGKFSGLCTDNGVSIYEGDIIDGKYNIEVIFKDGMFCGKQIGVEYYCALIEWGMDRIIIGNIYENPELLYDFNDEGGSDD